MSSVSSTSRTVSNDYFDVPQTKIYRSKANGKGYYKKHRSAEEKAHHAAATAAADAGEWVVKGKKHNKVSLKEDKQEKKEDTAKMLKDIQKTLHGAMSTIRPLKRKRAEERGAAQQPRLVFSDEKDEKKVSKKKTKAVNNSFALLAVDSTDDEAEEVEEVEDVSKETKTNTRPIEPKDFPEPPKTSVFSYAKAAASAPVPFVASSAPATAPASTPYKSLRQWTSFGDEDDDDEDEDEDDDYEKMKPGSCWGDFA